VQAQTQAIKIWPNLAPGSENVENNEQWTEGKVVSIVYQPEVTIYIPEHQAGLSPAIIVFPGGGYQKIVMEKEGYKVARWLNEHGIAAFVLKYRLNRDEALRDAQRAVSLIRNDAKKYSIDDTKIGVYGGYRDIFHGSEKSSLQEDIPPTFLVHAGNDSKVPVKASVELYMNLKENGIPAELHIYELGEHGFALETDRGPAVTSTVNDWSKRLLEWLRVRVRVRVRVIL